MTQNANTEQKSNGFANRMSKRVGMALLCASSLLSGCFEKIDPEKSKGRTTPDKEKVLEMQLNQIDIYSKDRTMLSDINNANEYNAPYNTSYGIRFTGVRDNLQNNTREQLILDMDFVGLTDMSYSQGGPNGSSSYQSNGSDAYVRFNAGTIGNNSTVPNFGTADVTIENSLGNYLFMINSNQPGTTTDYVTQIHMVSNGEVPINVNSGTVLNAGNPVVGAATAAYCNDVVRRQVMRTEGDKANDRKLPMAFNMNYTSMKISVGGLPFNTSYQLTPFYR